MIKNGTSQGTIIFNQIYNLFTIFTYFICRKSSYSVRKRENQILNAPYKGMYDPNIPKFGDIVLLGKGTLEKSDNDTYSFVQSEYDCDKHCFERNQEWHNVTAVWTVERIRHRDPDRGHRYELKFTVVPLHENKTNGADTGLRISKSYIVRDEDYPKYFDAQPSSTTTNTNQGRAMSVVVPRRTVTRRTDASTRRTIFDMFDFTPFTNAFNPFPGKMRPDLNMLEPFGFRQPNAIRMGPSGNGIPLMRMPMNKIRFPDQRTPFSGQQTSGVHIFLNGQPRKPPQQVPQATQLGKPGIFDLDKVYDYNKMMDYQGSINTKKVFPDLVKETTEVTDNTLDYRSTTQQQNHVRGNDQHKASSAANEGSFQYTTVFGPGVQNPPPTQTQVPQIGTQVTTGLLYPVHPPLHTIPFTVPHFPLAPWLFPFGPHPHPPLAHLPPQTPFSPPNIQQHHTQTNLIPHSNVQQLPTTTHYGIPNAQQGKDQSSIPPFQPLHHTMAKIRPLSRIPMSPPRKEVNVQVFKESPKEPQHYSAPDPFFPQTSTNFPSTSTYKSVLPSPYSTTSSESTTGATVFEKLHHFTHRPVHLTDEEEFQPIKPVVETTFSPTRTYHVSSSSTSKPDSINSQLPPPERGTNTRIPYMDLKTTKKLKTRNYGGTGPTGLGSIERVKPFKPSTLLYTTSTTTGSSVGSFSTSKYRNSFKTTEKPVLKWIPKKSRKPVQDNIPTLSSTTSTTTTARTTTFAQELGSSTTENPSRFEPTTIRPRYVPTTQASRPSTSTEIKSTVNVATSPSPNRYRGRGRFSLKRRGDNRTYYGSFEDGIASQESKTSISTSVSVEPNNRRKLNRKRVSRFNTTTTTSTAIPNTTTIERSLSPVFYVTTTPSNSPVLPTTSVEPPSTTAEIIKANVHPLDTKIDDLHLFKASDALDQSEIPSNINELDNLAVSILEHARSLHSAQSHYNHRNNNNKDNNNNNHYSSNHNNKQNIIDDNDNDKLPLENFFRQ